MKDNFLPSAAASVPSPDGAAEKGDSAAKLLRERWFLALAAIVLLHVILFGVAAVLVAIDRPDSLLIIVVAWLMAQCSLAAIGLARSKVASHFKAAGLGVFCGGVWLILVLILSQTGVSDSRAGSWLASLATQAACVLLGTVAIATIRNRRRALRQSAASYQYNILSLLIWTTVVAVALGLVSRLQWDWNVLRWQYLAELQLIALFNAALATCLLATIHSRQRWWIRLGWSLFAGLIVMQVTPAMMYAIFSAPGATWAEMRWLIGSQTLFLLAVLVPLRAATERPPAEEAVADTEDPTSPQTPPRPDSGR